MAPTTRSANPEVAELLRKYRQMLAMRLAHTAGVEAPGHVRAQMIALSARFPGALREIDEIELDELRRRIARLEGVVSGDCLPEPWMHAMAAFHSLARGALVAKRFLAGRKQIDETVERRYADALERLDFPEDARVWKNDLRLVASPPQGRMTALVFARLARALGITEFQARALVWGAEPRRIRRQGTRGA